MNALNFDNTTKIEYTLNNSVLKDSRSLHLTTLVDSTIAYW